MASTPQSPRLQPRAIESRRLAVVGGWVREPTTRSKEFASGIEFFANPFECSGVLAVPDACCVGPGQ